MVRRVITKYDKWATKPADTISLIAGVPQEIFKVKPEKKMALMLAEETYLFMKLRDSSGNEIPADTKIILAGKAPDDALPIQLTAAHLYKPWKDIELSEQKNEKYIANFQIDFIEPIEHFFEEGEELIVIAIASQNTEVSWANSEIEIPAFEMTMEELYELVGETGIDFAYDIPDEYYEEGEGYEDYYEG